MIYVRMIIFFKHIYSIKSLGLIYLGNIKFTIIMYYIKLSTFNIKYNHKHNHAITLLFIRY